MEFLHIFEVLDPTFMIQVVLILGIEYRKTLYWTPATHKKHVVSSKCTKDWYFFVSVQGLNMLFSSQKNQLSVAFDIVYSGTRSTVLIGNAVL